MTLQDRIKKKAEGYGKLAPSFIEGAKFALENQWISVEDDLPCNHKELIDPETRGLHEETIPVVVWIGYSFGIDYMIYENNEWKWRKWWRNYSVTHWMPIPEPPK